MHKHGTNKFKHSSNTLGREYYEDNGLLSPLLFFSPLIMTSNWAGINERRKDMKRIKMFLVGLIISVMLIIMGFGIATSMYSGGMKLKVPKITITWETIQHDLYLTDEISVQTEKNP